MISIYLRKINIWYLSSFLISIAVAIPIVTVFSSFFDSTSNYSDIIKNTFLYDYLLNSFSLIIWCIIFNFYHWSIICLLSFVL